VQAHWAQADIAERAPGYPVVHRAMSGSLFTKNYLN
jgi:hypothetical protein